MQFDFRIADVFSGRPFGGNQLAVVTGAGDLSSEMMQSIAREFNFSETTFVLPADDVRNAARVRIFTPTTELPFAGHPVIGTAAVLVENGYANEGTFTLELGVGPTDVEVQRSGDHVEATLVRRGQPDVRPSEATPQQLAGVLTLGKEDVLESFAASAGLPFCFVRLTNEAAVDKARLDAARWSRDMAATWAPQIYLFAGDLKEKSELYARMFAPGLGVDEDPATGSACVALAGAAATRVCPHSGTVELSIVQGVAMGRRSEIKASAEVIDGEVASVRVGGFTSFLAQGRITVPDEPPAT